jgi:hypothetical protein
MWGPCILRPKKKKKKALKIWCRKDKNVFGDLNFETWKKKKLRRSVVK